MTAYAYIGLNELKAALGVEVTDTTDDAALSLAIDAACEVVNNYCGRRFDLVTATRYYNVVEAGWLDVPDLVEITTLKTDEGYDGTFERTWATTDYHLTPYGALDDGRSYGRIIRALDGDYYFPRGTRSVEITGTFGYEEVPSAVRQATLIQATRLFKRKDAPFGVIGSAEMGQLQVVPTIDPDIKLLLAGYKTAPFIV
jgi:hypothetical protein